MNLVVLITLQPEQPFWSSSGLVLVQSTVFGNLHHSNSRWREPGMLSHLWGEVSGRQFICVDAQNCKTREGIR